MSLLDVKTLTVSLQTGQKRATIVEDLSFSLGQGQSLGIVGESGSGKSTAALAIMGLLAGSPLRVEGDIAFAGENLMTMPRSRFRAMQGKDIAMIFQDPMSSLNPVHRIGDQIIECLLAHERMPRAKARELAIEALDRVGMPEPAAMMRRYPHQLSGGQRQRVLISMAVVFKPKLLIADEPTTALDLTIQAQILSLLKDLARDLDMALVLITHDLGVVAEMTETVLVLYSGRVVERSPTSYVLDAPRHPYTQGLLAAYPSMDGTSDRLTPIPGGPPSVGNRPSGCPFRLRCPAAREICAEAQPPTMDIGQGDQRVACVLAGDESPARRSA